MAASATSAADTRPPCSACTMPTASSSPRASSPNACTRVMRPTLLRCAGPPAGDALSPGRAERGQAGVDRGGVEDVVEGESPAADQPGPVAVGRGDDPQVAG